jgi:hypothetical protein
MQLFSSGYDIVLGFSGHDNELPGPIRIGQFSGFRREDWDVGHLNMMVENSS